MSQRPGHKTWSVLGVAIACIVGSGGDFASAATPASLPPAPSGLRLPRRFAFEANRGQTDARVGFLARTGDATVFVTPSSCVLALGAAGGQGGTALRLTLAGAREAHLEGEQALPGRVSDFHGSDPARWRSGIPTYAAVRAHDIVPGVDALYHGADGSLEYDFVVAPGVDPASLRLRVEGADSLELARSGDLVALVSGRTVVHKAPRLYQETAAGAREVAGGFVLHGSGEFGFEACGGDPTEPLVIDPVVAYSTYLGGSGGDTGYAIAVDGSGNAYVSGTTTSANFPATAGAHDTTYNGDFDMFVSKLTPDGATLLWSTYLGGSGGDWSNGIAVDGEGNVHVEGWVGSTDFPTTPSAFQPAYGGGAYDATLTKLSPAGDALLYSTYLGGSGNDTPQSQVALDAAGFTYIAGHSTSANLPTTADAYQRTLIGSRDVFVAKFDTLASGAASLVYSTYIGTDNVVQYGLAVDGGGRAYITGYTNSGGYPTTPGAFDRTYNGGTDAFVSKIDTNVPGTAGLVYSTFLGGRGGDEGRNVTVNAAGEAFVAGGSSSTDFPTTANAYSRTLRGKGVNAGDTILTRLNASGSALLYSTYFGGAKSANEQAGAVVIDNATGHAVIGGYTSSTDFPVTASALQPTFHGGGDGFLAEFDTAASGSASLSYSSYLGGAGNDRLYRLAVGPAGSWFATGYTFSTDFPVTPGAFQTSHGGGGNNDAFVYRQDR